MTIQTNRGLVLAAIESSFNEAEALSAATDAFEVIAPDFTPDITSQRRQVVAPDLSPFASLVTRKVGQMSFGIEVKSNGNTDATVAPRVGRLLRACGFAETQINTAAETVFRTVANAANTGDLNFYGTTTVYDGGIISKIKVTITSGGASGVATASFEAPAEAANGGGNAQISMTDTDDVLLTDGAEITLHDNAGNPIVSLTPDFQSNNPATGDVYWVHIQPRGYQYLPISDNIPSVTIDMQYPDDSGQSIRHRLLGARGTFTMDMAVGEFPVFNFTFTGTYVDQVDEATLTGTFEDQDPAQVEYAALAIAQRYGEKETGLCAAAVSIDMGNTVVIRDCINGDEASKGAFIVGRQPVISYDPEAVLAAVEPIWSYLENGTSVEFWLKHGTVNGNIVLFHAPNHQITDIAYGDRDGIRTFNIDGSLARLNGNDELRILFT